jgi:hypothetical protein
MSGYASATIGAPGPAQERELRRHQGIPGVEIMPDGELFVCFYANTEPGEGPGNYAVVARSSDGGLSWREVSVVVPPVPERVFDPVLWRSPDGVLRLFYAQGGSDGLHKPFDGRAGVWTAHLIEYDAEKTVWSAPRRISDGVMMNKPEVLADGAWLLPVALWSIYPEKEFADLKGKYRPNLLVTRDRGESFEFILGPDVPERTYDEHVAVERRDGSWLVAVRTRRGARAVVTNDRGRNYSGVFTPFAGGADSRFALRRLKSGKWCLVTHAVPEPCPGENWKPSRCNLAVWLSEDEGASWRGRLMLDEHAGVSYPDFTEDAAGNIYIAYDRTRIKGHGQVWLAKITEADILAGAFVTPGSFPGILVDAFPFKP